MNTIKLFNVSISNLTMQDLDNEILHAVRDRKKGLVLAVNVHTMNLIYRYEWLRHIYKQSFAVHCDGDGVRLGAKFLGKTIKEKITFNTWIWELAAFSEIHSLSWFLLGSTQDTVNRARYVLSEKYPRLKILGAHHGFIQNVKEEELLINQINECKPNLLILGMGQPLQEKWLYTNLYKLNINIGLGGGAVFEYVAGNIKITPKFIVAIKMEWFYRFLQQPKRLFKRYFLGNPIFFYRVFYSIIFRKNK